MLVKLNKKQVNTIEDLEEARFRHSKDSQYFQGERDYYLMMCNEVKEDNKELLWSNQNMEEKLEFLERENRLLIDDRVSLSHEAAYLRALLSQYEPNEKNQDKEMYH